MWEGIQGVILSAPLLGAADTGISAFEDGNTFAWGLRRKLLGTRTQEWQRSLPDMKRAVFRREVKWNQADHPVQHAGLRQCLENGFLLRYQPCFTYKVFY